MSARLEALVLALGERKVIAMLKRAALTDGTLTAAEKKLLIAGAK